MVFLHEKVPSSQVKSHSIADTRRPQQRGADPLSIGPTLNVTSPIPAKGLVHGQVMHLQRTASQLVNIWLEKDQQGLSNARRTVLYGEFLQERIRRRGEAGAAFRQVPGIRYAGCEARRHKNICHSLEIQHCEPALLPEGAVL